MDTAFQVRSNLEDGYQRGKPVRSEPYLAFIRRQASVKSGYGPCHACHTGPHGAGQEADDRLAIPLTWEEHGLFDADPKGYAERHMLDVPNLIEQLNELFVSNGGIY
jgi:hypothetical protein